MASSNLSSSGRRLMAHDFTMPSLLPTSTSLELLECPNQSPSSHLVSIAIFGPVVGVFLYHIFSPNGTTSTLQARPVWRW